VLVHVIVWSFLFLVFFFLKRARIESDLASSTASPFLQQASYPARIEGRIHLESLSIHGSLLEAHTTWRKLEEIGPYRCNLNSPQGCTATSLLWAGVLSSAPEVLHCLVADDFIGPNPRKEWRWESSEGRILMCIFLITKRDLT
jgi:hypothetical protein